MKTALKNFRIITYGEIFSELETSGLREAVSGISPSRNWSLSVKRKSVADEYLLVSSKELNDTFAEAFREHATQATKLIVFFDEGFSTDRLLSRIVDLQIRTPHRFYLMEGNSRTCSMRHVHAVLKRLASALEADEKQERILDAKIEDGVLRVVSPDFNRLDVLIEKIPELKNADSSQIQAFEIDEDGSFIYWPELDLHLGWHQLQQCIDPEAALKASQKTQDFNIRYGKAVQRVRKQAGLKTSEVEGLSEKQLRRIENGDCRLTSHAIEALSRAHNLKPNEYLQKLAKSLAD